MKKQPKPADPKATVKELLGKLGAATRRLNEDRAFTYQQLALIEFEKTRAANLDRLLRSALEAMEVWPYLPDNVIYYFRAGLKVTMEREEAEHQARVKAREAVTKRGTDGDDGTTAAGKTDNHTPAAT